ncbi:hypothetical protein [Sphingomonas sp. BK069]|uniref:hypothetical protein n=1 Tax=Sphingomonas sp. BK069 TaxID=2586979 RepID=UPI00161BAF29|nr:hypothetical protein [Sphingomonas sp. BK069]MBB3349738.1 hypothetical protein [Sphingomonas sp. BK069]
MSTYAERRIQVVEGLQTFESFILDVKGGDARGLAQQRVTLVQSVNAYFGHLSGQVGTISGHAADAWRGELETLTALRHRYSQHIARWTVDETLLHWSEYRTFSQELVRAMRAHLDRTERFPPL